jgi:hypothetical protein
MVETISPERRGDVMTIVPQRLWADQLHAGGELEGLIEAAAAAWHPTGADLAVVEIATGWLRLVESRHDPRALDAVAYLRRSSGADRPDARGSVFRRR